MGEAFAVKMHWKTSMHVGSLVTLVAAVHYFYMREYWVQIGHSPIVYRYIDWTITVPLQMVEFYLILSAVQPTIGGGMFWRLLIGTVKMHWKTSMHVGALVTLVAAVHYFYMRIIVSVGWAIYPLGYFLGMTGNGNESILNLVYNLADFVNKIAFCLAIWHAAKEETLQTGSHA